MVRCLYNSCWCEGSLDVLSELDRILHSLEVDIDRVFKLNRFRQGLPARLEIRGSNSPLPIHEVIHEVLGSDAVEPHLPLFFRG